MLRIRKQARQPTLHGSHGEAQFIDPGLHSAIEDPLRQTLDTFYQHLGTVSRRPGDACLAKHPSVSRPSSVAHSKQSASAMIERVSARPGSALHQGAED